MTTNELQPTVAIVMCTYNGSNHIDTQLQSLFAQNWPTALYAFDDASTDDTVEKLQASAQRLDIKLITNDQNLGYVANFESGIARVLADGYDYIALCDQDDVWEPNRIAAGMQRLLSIEATQGPEFPALVHSDLTMIDANNHLVHPSFFEYRQYAINNTRSLPTILGQNGVMGNTILMNRALASMALPFPPELHVHDYWLAVLVELFGHREQIAEPLVRYRIHSNNASNSNDSIKFGFKKLIDGKSWRGFIKRDYRVPFKEDSRIGAINTLVNGRTEIHGVTHLPQLSTEQRQLLETFQSYLQFQQPKALIYYAMLKSGFFRKGLWHRLRLAFSTMLTKRYEH